MQIYFASLKFLAATLAAKKIKEVDFGNLTGFNHFSALIPGGSDANNIEFYLNDHNLVEFVLQLGQFTITGVLRDGVVYYTVDTEFMYEAADISQLLHLNNWLASWEDGREYPSYKWMMKSLR